MNETNQPTKEQGRGGFLRNLYTTFRSLRGLRGLMGDQKRDIDAETGHPFYIQPEDYWAKFDRGDIAARVVALYPEECFKDRPLIYEDEDPNVDTDFEKEWDALEDELHLLSFLTRADILSGIGRYGIILLGLDDGLDLSEPVAGYNPNPTNPTTRVQNAFPPKRAAAAPPQQAPAFGTPAMAPKLPPEPTQPEDTTPAPATKRRLLYLRTLDESMVKIKELEKDPRNPRFGQPVRYTLTFWDNQAENNAQGGVNIIAPPPPSSGINALPAADNTSLRTTLNVHWTRVIHLADNRLRDEIFGTPRLRKVFDRILDLHKVASGSAEMFWKQAKGGLSLETMPADEPIQVDKEATKQELEEFYEGLKPYLVLEGMTAKQLAPTVADPGPHGMFQLHLIASALACPLRIFMGSEEGKLASGQDIVAWNERLQKRREEYLTPFVIRPFVDRLIALGVLPFPKGDKDVVQIEGRPPRPAYCVYWDDLNTPSSVEQAAVGLQRTQAMAAYINGGVDQLIDPPHYLELVLGFDKDEVESILTEVGDRLYQTDPAAEHQQALEKIQATADAKAQVAAKTGVVPGGSPPGRNGAPKKAPATAA
jgi:hypothetical protein